MRGAWSTGQPVTAVAPPPQSSTAWSNSGTVNRWNEENPKEFAQSLYEIWWRLPAQVQTSICDLLLVKNGQSDELLEYTDAYSTILRICKQENGISKETLVQVKAHVFTTHLLDMNQKRTMLLHFWVKNQPKVTEAQQEILAGIVASMVPQREAFNWPANRIIGAAITNGADFDAFQMFIDLLLKTLEINKATEKVA